MKEYNNELANLDNVEILGFTGEIESIPKTLKQVEDIRNSCCDVGIIQLMNADAIAGKEHLQQGVIHAINAFKRGENLAKDLGIEQRQISKAFNILGLKEGNMNIAVVLIDCPDYFIDELSDMFVRNDAVLEADESILLNLYDIPEKELKKMHITDILIDKTTRLLVDQ